MPSIRLLLLALAALLLSPEADAQKPSNGGGASPIETALLKEWLTYLASDRLEGREVYTEGLDLAATYVASHLEAWGIKPGGEDGSYFQHVKASKAGDERPTRNVVGIVDGSDRGLSDTYVVFGAHYDHIGRVTPAKAGAPENFGCPGQLRAQPRPDDVINNGADDDGSGTVALMALARAFAKGPRPRRSLVFIWHTAEENGLLGSRHNADHPAVPNDRILAHLNVDMIGRNRCDREAEANTVYLVGSDRISTELHNLSEDANAAMARPLTLDYELNDPADPLSLYTRSDHYSYAAKGIPVIFYTTGLHRDYHHVTDEIGRIEWDKLTRVTQLVYVTGQRLANLDRAPLRDNKGPRMGRGSRGRLSARYRTLVSWPRIAPPGLSGVWMLK